MRKRRSRFHKHLSKFFLPSILGLSIILGLSVVYAVFSSPLNIDGQGAVKIGHENKDFYYSDGYFYISSNKDILVYDEKDSPIRTMKEAVEQISDGKTIYMMSSYSSSENEKISVSKKSIFIKRYVDEQYGGWYSFKNGPLIISPSDLEITVADSSSALVIDGSELNNPNSNYSGDNFQNCTGAIYSPSGSLILNGCPQTNNLIIQNHCGVSSAIYKQSGSFQMSNCKISNNLVGSSGAIVKVKVGDDSDSSLKAATCEISNSEFSENEGSDETTSVAAFDLNSTENQITSTNLDEGIKVDINSCNISKNNLTALEFAAENSTGKYCNYAVSNSTISNNTSSIGGINFVNAGGTIQDCSITGNKSTKNKTTRNSSAGGINASSLPVVLKGKNIVKDNLLSNKENSNLNFYPSSLVTSELSADSQIGLSCSSEIITETTPATTNSSAQSATQNTTYFFADNSEDYEVKLNSSDLQLAIKPSDYYYKNSSFYRDSNLTKVVIDPNGDPISYMQSAVNQITDQKTIYMLGKYTVSSTEKISLSNKSVTIKRDSSFTNDSMFQVDKALNVQTNSNSSIMFDGNSNVTVNVGGGCFAVSENGVLRIEGNIYLQNNRSSYTRGGGAVHIANNADARIDGVKIRSNYARHGGGIRNDGRLELNNCNVSGNTAERSGAGVLTGSTATSTIISNTTFSNNVGSVRGGGLSIDGFSSTGNIKVSDCIFQNNKSGLGGAISLPPEKDVGEIEISSCSIINNTATQFGGGIYANTYFKLSGILVVEDNKNGTGESDNLYLTDGVLLNPSENKINFSPTSGSTIGISLENTPTESSKVSLSYKDCTDYLFSDNQNYNIVYDSSSNMTLLSLKSS